MEDGLIDFLQLCISISINYLDDGIQNVLLKFIKDTELGETKRTGIK